MGRRSGQAHPHRWPARPIQPIRPPAPLGYSSPAADDAARSDIRKTGSLEGTPSMTRAKKRKRQVEGQEAMGTVSERAPVQPSNEP
uniref:Uncharacterized protein n=1 Tax=Anopheles christyi TaxID=43041 RepID=A0A182KIV0_9DIPT